MKNPRFGYGDIGQTSQVNTVNMGLPIRGTDVGRPPPRERKIQTQNIYYPAQFRNDNANGKTLNKLRNSRPLII